MFDMFNWLNRKESGIEIIAKKDKIALLNSFTEKFKEYKDILTSFSKQDTQTFKDIEEVEKELEKYLDAVKDIKQSSEYNRLIKLYDKKLEKAKEALETLNAIDVTPKKQQKAEQQVAEILGEQPQGNAQDNAVDSNDQSTDTNKTEQHANTTDTDKQEFKDVASIKEKLLKKNAEDTNGNITLTKETVSDPSKLEKATKILEDKNKSKEQKAEEIKSNGLGNTSTYNTFLKQCFGSEDSSINTENLTELNEEFKKQVEELKNLL